MFESDKKGSTRSPSASLARWRWRWVARRA